MPFEFEKTISGLTAVLRQSWEIAENAEDNREKIQALGLIKEVHSVKIDLLSHSEALDRAVRFVSEHKNDLIPNNTPQTQTQQKVKEETKGTKGQEATATETETETDIAF